MLQALTQFAADCPNKGISILPPWHKYIDGEVVDGTCELNFSIPDDIIGILLAVVEILLRLGGIVAVGFVIYGGFLFMLSRGEPDKNAQARTTIINALIGLVVAL